jgi:hypothetical protein
MGRVCVHTVGATDRSIDRWMDGWIDRSIDSSGSIGIGPQGSEHMHKQRRTHVYTHTRTYPSGSSSWWSRCQRRRRRRRQPQPLQHGGGRRGGRRGRRGGGGRGREAPLVSVRGCLRPFVGRSNLGVCVCVCVFGCCDGDDELLLRESEPLSGWIETQRLRGRGGCQIASLADCASVFGGGCVRGVESISISILRGWGMPQQACVCVCVCWCSVLLLPCRRRRLRSVTRDRSTSPSHHSLAHPSKGPNHNDAALISLTHLPTHRPSSPT